jgi:hypothetical protein
MSTGLLENRGITLPPNVLQSAADLLAQATRAQDAAQMPITRGLAALPMRTAGKQVVRYSRPSGRRASAFKREGGLMLYPIEIKANIDGDVDGALAALGRPVPSTKRLIWFGEDGDGLADGEVRLLSGGVILRFRSGEGPDDSTVKLRPSQPSGWMPPWGEPFETDLFEYRIEGDWSGERRSIAASAVATFGQGSLAQAGGGAPLRKGALTSQQESLLWLCSDVWALQRVVVLGPIASTKWSDLRLAGLKVSAERWSVEDLDFLELSIRVKPTHDDTPADLQTRAEKRQAEFVAAIADLGLSVATDTDNKTQRVLTALASSK